MKHVSKHWRVFAVILTAWFVCLPCALAQGVNGVQEEDDEDVFPPFIQADELRRLIKEGLKDILILDNAPTPVWEEAHIPGAVSYPWVRQIADIVKFARNKTLVLYCPCAHDEDSIDMAKKLRELGYFKIKVLEGGWFKWEKLGFETVSAAGEQQSK